jgi:hypothetical protein
LIVEIGETMKALTHESMVRRLFGALPNTMSRR